ncbi:hypothetical protein KDM41_07515 [bacterium]|nr:hypothetical protein [bacterium]
MDLHSAIATALDLTGALADALAESRLDDCADLLPRRGDAMAAFAAAHEAAGPAEREACRTVLEALAAADGHLQQSARSARDAAGVAVRSRLGAAPRPGLDSDGPPACLDRKV